MTPIGSKLRQKPLVIPEITNPLFFGRGKNVPDAVYLGQGLIWNQILLNSTSNGTLSGGRGRSLLTQNCPQKSASDAKETTT